jgi:hypothetical protein
METIAQASTAIAARQVMCSMCWAPPDTPCQQHPAGSHQARYIRARRQGLLPERDMDTVLDAADVFTTATVIRDGAL